MGTDRGAAPTADAPVVLTIRPGVVLFGATGTSWLVVNRGNRIQAVGTATSPIVFTSRDNVLGLANDDSQGQRGGVVLLGIVAARLAVGLIAVPLAPFLYREHAAVLVLLRPSKEVLVFEGFLVQDGRVGLLTVVIAALPLLLGGVWAMFALGRAYQDEVCEERSGLAGRLLPADKVQSLVDAVEARGMLLVFLGRLAAFPSTLVGAAAPAPTG